MDIITYKIKQLYIFILYIHACMLIYFISMCVICIHLYTIIYLYICTDIHAHTVDAVKVKVLRC